MRFIQIPSQCRNSSVKPHRRLLASRPRTSSVRGNEESSAPPNSELIEQACNRDHHSSDPCSQAKKQQITDEDRHVTPPSPLCWGELNSPRNCLGMVSDTWLQKLQTLRWGCGSQCWPSCGWFAR